MSVFCDEKCYRKTETEQTFCVFLCIYFEKYSFILIKKMCRKIPNTPITQIVMHILITIGLNYERQLFDSQFFRISARYE